MMTMITIITIPSRMVVQWTWIWLYHSSHRTKRSFLSGWFQPITFVILQFSNTIILSGTWARLKLSINITQEAEAACLDVGGYLVEPRSEHREEHLEEIAEASNPYTVFTNCFLSKPSPPPSYHHSLLVA